MTAPEAVVFTAIGAVLGFFGKTFWSALIKRYETAHDKRVAFLERQLSELYWPLYMHLQRDNAVWERILDKGRLDEGKALVGAQIETDVILPNHAATVTLITEKIHLLGHEDRSMIDLLLKYIRHVAVYQAMRATGDLVRFPKALGENFPNDLFAKIEDRTKGLQKQYDVLIGRMAAKGKAS